MFRIFQAFAVLAFLSACAVPPSGEVIPQAETEQRLAGRTLQLLTPGGQVLGTLKMNADGTGLATTVAGDKRSMRWQVVESSLCLTFSEQSFNRSRDCAPLVWTSSNTLVVTPPGAGRAFNARIVG